MSLQLLGPITETQDVKYEFLRVSVASLAPQLFRVHLSADVNSRRVVTSAQLEKKKVQIALAGARDIKPAASNECILYLQLGEFPSIRPHGHGLAGDFESIVPVCCLSGNSLPTWSAMGVRRLRR